MYQREPGWNSPARRGRAFPIGREVPRVRPPRATVPGANGILPCPRCRARQFQGLTMNSDDQRSEGNNPYSSPGSELERGRVDAPMAGLLKRLAASMVDNFLVMACFLGPPLAAGELGLFLESLQTEDPVVMREALVNGGYTATPILSLALAAFNLVLLYRDGQTIGKRMLGTRIVRTSGARAGLLRILCMRSWLPGMVYMLPAVGPMFLVFGHAAILLNPRRCFHDYLADTKVVEA